MTGATGATDAVEPLLAAARSLWPTASVAVGTVGTVGAGTSYALVPSARAPRMLVPLTPPGAAARAVCRFSSASTARDVATRLTAAALTWATRGALLRDRVEIDEAGSCLDESLRGHLSGVLGEEITFSLAIGPPRVNRKPVLQVFDRRGRTVAFAKVGDSTQARSDVRAEGAHLRRLEGRTFRDLQVPVVLDTSVWSGMDVLVMSALPAGPPQVWTRDAPPWAAMMELSAAFSQASVPLVELPWFRRQCDAGDARTATSGAEPDDLASELASELARCVDAIAERYGERIVTVGAWHGDWTPWNMARRRDRVLLWDWERFETGVPAGLDAWHYRVNVLARRRGMTPSHVLAGVTARGHDPMVADLYLLAITRRYVDLLGAARGDDVRPSAVATLTALRTRLVGRDGLLGRRRPVTG